AEVWYTGGHSGPHTVAVAYSAPPSSTSVTVGADYEGGRRLAGSMGLAEVSHFFYDIGTDVQDHAEIEMRFVDAVAGSSEVRSADGSVWTLGSGAELVPLQTPGGQLESQTVVIQRGRSDEASTVQPTSTTFTLANLNGEFTPNHPASPHYPNVRRGTPCRISVAWEGLWYTRFVGFINEWAVSWPEGDNGESQ